LNTMTVLNLKNQSKNQPLFLGEPLALQRYDRFKYPAFFELFKTQEEFFWWPHEVTLQKDALDYKKLTDTERFVFDTNLRFQILGDSMLSRSIHALKNYVSNAELEACMVTWARFELIHSYSYSYLINNVYPDPSGFFDSILADQEIVSRSGLIRSSYDKILGDPHKKDVKEKIFDCILATNVMEGLVFYVSFACSFYFGYRGTMEGNAKIIKFIQRDEAQHFAITQNLLKILKDEEGEGFMEIVKKNEDQIYAVYEQAAKNEIAWAEYLFAKGSLLGLNVEVLGGYAKWLCDNRLRSLGYKKIFNSKENPISGWLDSYLDSSKVQFAPQETELQSYKIAARDTSIKTSDFDHVEL